VSARLVVSTAEASGDRLLAELIEALRSIGAQIPVVGNVGPLAVAAGATPLPGLVRPPAAMGITEVLRSIPTHRRNRAVLLSALRPGDTLLTVDSPDLHNGLARIAKGKGIPTIGYVSPQLWAWRPRRAPAIATAYDRLLCLFPFEPPLYAATGLDARWVGHPAIERVKPSTREPGVLALFPGSRPAELKRHLPIFLDVAARAGAREVLLAAAPGVALPAMKGVSVVTASEAMARADRALTKSGTVTLELVLARIPTVVAHRVSPVTYYLGRRLVRGVKHIALPNILLDRAAVAEHVQNFDAGSLLSALNQVAEPPTEALTAVLGRGGASIRAAQAVLEPLSLRIPQTR
jgi:lipid-A-disaccharide synthase